jgi:hypothetical protein
MLVALVLLGMSSPGAWCADRKGTMDLSCCTTTFNLRVLHQSKQQHAPERELVLEFRIGCPPYNVGPWEFPDWVKVRAKLCDQGSDGCEIATSAALRVDSASKNHKHVEGSYRVDFPTSGHEEGRFMVKYHHQGPKPECL